MAIQTVRQRDRLKARREPYWALIGTGQHVGYRVTDDGGTWIARAYDPGTRKRVYRSLGNLAPTPPAEQYTAATRAAADWFKHIEAGGEAEVISVADAFRAYIEHQREDKGETAAKDAQSRFARHIESDPIARIELLKLKPQHVKQWRSRLSKRPAIAARRGPKCRLTTPPTPPRPRAAATLKRDLVALRAALNLAQSNGYVASNMAWRRALEPPEANETQGSRDVYLSADQRRAVLDAIEDPALADFVRAMCLLPVRPGALARLRVGDFVGRENIVNVRVDKNKKAKGARKVPLPTAAADLFRKRARGKLPGAFLFTRADGVPWDKNGWRAPFRDACERAELDTSITLYALRHSTITDLVTGGLDLFTVAKLSGTSVAMIEAHYGHIQEKQARAALAGLNL